MIEITFFLWSYLWVFVGSGLIFFSPPIIRWLLKILGFRKIIVEGSADALEAMTKIDKKMKPYLVFYYNSSATELSVTEKTTLKTWVLQGRDSGGFLIKAHSDQLGPAAMRKKIAQKRGDSVKGLLLNWGVSPKKLSLENCEDRELAHPSNAAKNRRVEIHFLT